jgi:hypothetical protein
MSSDTTIIYITDNALDSEVARVCQQHLIKAADGRRIVSVSQKPMDFGDNICVGNLGKSHININKQMKAGLENVNTRFIAVAEHDCVYSKEHFNWTPPTDKFFYYNTNCWLLQYYSKKYPEWNGTFSYMRRRAHSQMLTGRDLMLETMDRQIRLLSSKDLYKKHWRAERRRVLLAEGKLFRNETPNLDIRHKDNFTGARRGRNRRWSLEPWGTVEDVFNV